jgi:hypothetical protein
MDSPVAALAPVVATRAAVQDNSAMIAPAPPRRLGGALAVGAGIFLSRLAGLVRDRVLAQTLSLSSAADAFRAALRIPNLLQNLLGEGVLSASFIPVYARLRAEAAPKMPRGSPVRSARCSPWWRAPWRWVACSPRDRSSSCSRRGSTTTPAL